MKKLLTLALAMLMVLSLAACGSTGSTGSTNSTNSSNGAGSTNEGDATFTTVEDGKLIMATNCQFPPYEMVADGEGAYQGYEGIDIELAVAIAVMGTTAIGYYLPVLLISGVITGAFTGFCGQFTYARLAKSLQIKPIQ